MDFCLLFIMNEPEKEAEILQTLNKYLKHFKNIVHLQLTFIEYLFADPSLALPIFQKIKITPEFQSQTENHVSLNRDMWKQVERLCLRINQYLDFRLIKCKSIPDRAVVGQIENFQLSLQRAFSEIHQQTKNEGKSLSPILSKIHEIEGKCFKKLVRLSAMKANLQRNNYEEIIEFFYKKYGNHQPYLPNSNKEDFLTIKKQCQIRFQNDLKKKTMIRSRRVTIQSNRNMADPKQKGNMSCLEKPEIYTLEIKEKKIEKKKIRSFLDDVMELERYDEKSENLYKDLLARNRKNMTIIRRYRKEMEKKWKGTSVKTIGKEGNITKETHKRSMTLESSFEHNFTLKKDDKKSFFPFIKKVLNSKH